MYARATGMFRNDEGGVGAFRRWPAITNEYSHAPSMLRLTRSFREASVVESKEMGERL